MWSGNEEGREKSAEEDLAEDISAVEEYAREAGVDMDSKAELIMMASQLIYNNNVLRERGEEKEGEGSEEKEGSETRRKKERARDNSSKSRSRRDPSAEKRSKSRSCVRQVVKRATSEEEDGEMEH